MSASVFDRAFAVVIGEEGGYGNDPRDPGGETKYGISKRAYPGVDIAGLTLESARAIYRRDYWQPIQGDALPAPVALLVFDAAVNAGVQRAATWLQAAVGARQDGRIGPKTLLALSDVLARRGGASLCAELVAQRTYYMGGLPTWRTFGLGWSRRLAGLPYHAIQMVQK